MDISFVDGFNSNINLLSTKYNISTNFGSNTCDIAGGYYTKGVCLSPCLTWDLDLCVVEIITVHLKRVLDQDYRLVMKIEDGEKL